MVRWSGVSACLSCQSVGGGTQTQSQVAKSPAESCKSPQCIHNWICHIARFIFRVSYSVSIGHLLRAAKIIVQNGECPAGGRVSADKAASGAKGQTPSPSAASEPSPEA